MPTALKHGHSRKGKVTRIYRCWDSMIDRCNNPNHKWFEDYGGRGIQVCERWKKFLNFLEDMGEPPKGWSIERVNNDKGYSIDNCVWATRIHQARNKRNSRMITFKGKTVCLAEMAEMYNVSRKLLRKRLFYGWTIERAILEPSSRMCRPGRPRVVIREPA